MTKEDALIERMAARAAEDDPPIVWTCGEAWWCGYKLKLTAAGGRWPWEVRGPLVGALVGFGEAGHEDAAVAQAELAARGARDYVPGKVA